MRLEFVLLASLVAAAPVAAQDNSVVAIRAARIFDPSSGAYIRNGAIVVRGRRVVSAGSSALVPSGARVIDLGDATLMPGLIDAHVHLTIRGRPRDNAVATLRAGFTTVQDLGALRGANLRLRDSIALGRFEGPRMIVAGPWIGASHGTCDFDSTQVSGDTAIARRVREAVGARADVIKLCVTGWPAAYALPAELSQAEVRAGVREAHAAHRRVFAHAIGRAGARLAIGEGVDALCHAAFVDQADIEAMLRRRMPMIPTLASFEAAGDSASLALVAHARWAMSRGVGIVFGTDAGVIPHGSNAQEFAALARAGVTPAAALRAATLDAARLLGISDSVGALEPGYLADIIAVHGDPLADIGVMGHVLFVMQGGVVKLQPQAGAEDRFGNRIQRYQRPVGPRFAVPVGLR